MITLYLVRHGETNWNAERRVQGQMDSVLNERGINQAETLRPTIEKLSIERAYTSTSLRTRQTAEILLSGSDLTLIPDPDLMEIKLGPWEGRLWSDVDEFYPDKSRIFKNEPHRFELEDAESYLDVQQRGMTCIRKIALDCCSNGVNNVLVVSHGMYIKTLIAGLAKVPLELVRSGPDIENCSLSIIDYSRDTFDVREVAGVRFTAVDW